MNIKNEFGFINLWIVNITINNFLITIKYFLHTFTDTITFTITNIYFHIFIYITEILTLHNPHIILNYLYLSLNKYR